MPRFARRSDLLKSRLGRFTKALHDVDKGDVRAIHRTRVASRRLRELLPVLRLHGGSAEKVNRRLRRVTRQLGNIRELDVLLTAIDELAPAHAHEQRALAQLKSDVSRSREEARRAAQDSDVVANARKVASKLVSLAKDLDQDDADRGREPLWRWALDARVARRAAALDRAVEAAGAVFVPARLHQVRIALKKLRYGAELAADANGRPDRRTLGALRRAQRLLGRLHDLQVLVDRVRGAQAAMTPPDVNSWRDLDRLVRPLEHTCRRLHADYVRDRPLLVEICGRLAIPHPDNRSRKAV